MARTALVMVRLSDDELAALDAARGDRKRSAYLRSRIPRRAKRAPEPAMTDDLDSLSAKLAEALRH